MDGNSDPRNLRATSLPARISFSRRLADWRYTLNQSRKEFAAAVGVAYSTLCHWLSARRAPNMDNLQNIADYLGIPVRCLLCNPDDTRCKPCPHPKPLRCPHHHADCPRLTPPSPGPPA